jgi:malonate transporter
VSRGLGDVYKRQRHGLAGFCASALLVTTVASFFTISLILWGMSFVPGWHI